MTSIILLYHFLHHITLLLWLSCRLYHQRTLESLWSSTLKRTLSHLVLCVAKNSLSNQPNSMVSLTERNSRFITIMLVCTAAVLSIALFFRGLLGDSIKSRLYVILVSKKLIENSVLTGFLQVVY